MPHNIAQFIVPGGQIGIVSPGLQREFDDGVPEHLAQHWHPEFWSFHSPAWWRRHWERSGTLDIETADSVEDGPALWLKWLEICSSGGFPGDPEGAAMLRADAGRNIGFTRVVARRKLG